MPQGNASQSNWSLANNNDQHVQQSNIGGSRGSTSSEKAPNASPNLIGNGKMHIIMEYAECGDVYQLILQQKQKGRYFAEKDLWSFAWQLCLGVLHLHSHDIIHRDIKCMNLLLKDQSQTVKLGDMSESRVLTHQSYIKTNKLIGTPQSLSPEVIKNENYDQRSDIWALGVSIYHMACLEPPFNEETMQSLFKSIQYKNPKPIHTCYSPKLQEFIFKMLEKKKNNRPLVIDLIDYFNQAPLPSVANFIIKKNTVDHQNFINYTEQCKHSYDRKRMIESNQVSINDEFSALKSRVVNKAKNFKANYLNFKGVMINNPNSMAMMGLKKSQYGFNHPTTTGGGLVKTGELMLKEGNQTTTEKQASSALPEIQRAQSPKKLRNITAEEIQSQYAHNQHMKLGGLNMYLSNASGIGLSNEEKNEAVRISIQRQLTANSKVGLVDSNTYNQFRRTIGGASSLETKHTNNTNTINSFTNQKFQSNFGKSPIFLNNIPIHTQGMQGNNQIQSPQSTQNPADFFFEDEDPYNHPHQHQNVPFTHYPHQVFIDDDILLASQQKRNGEENLLSNRQFVGYEKQKSINKKQRQEITEADAQQIRGTSPSPEATRNEQKLHKRKSCNDAQEIKIENQMPQNNSSIVNGSSESKVQFPQYISNIHNNGNLQIPSQRGKPLKNQLNPIPPSTSLSGARESAQVSIYSSNAKNIFNQQQVMNTYQDEIAEEDQYIRVSPLSKLQVGGGETTTSHSGPALSFNLQNNHINFQKLQQLNNNRNILSQTPGMHPHQNYPQNNSAGKPIPNVSSQIGLQLQNQAQTIQNPGVSSSHIFKVQGPQLPLKLLKNQITFQPGSMQKQEALHSQQSFGEEPMIPATADSQQKNRRQISQSYVGMSQQDFGTVGIPHIVDPKQQLITSSQVGLVQLQGIQSLQTSRFTQPQQQQQQQHQAQQSIGYKKRITIKDLQ